ncbi:TniQ family protein [Paraburkholderia caffeinilytica]|uniref:TniQ family protein n=1 Tax=Paraburkholderia caffeinilytica TaxID=1761016 RepID=UPI003DA03D88
MTPTYICKEVSGLNKSPSWIFPTNLARYIELLGDRVGSENDVLANNTLLPGYTRFLFRSAREQLRQRHLTESQWSSATELGMTRMSRPIWNPAVCMICLQDDLTPNGTPFWRRDFLFSHTRFCPRHETPLYEMCGACTHSSRVSDVITSPLDSCICGNPLKARTHTLSERAQEIELDIARGWSTLLDSSFCPRMRGIQFADLLHQVARAHGLIWRGRIQRRKYQALVSDSAKAEVIMSLRIPVSGPLIHRALAGFECPRNPFVSIFMLVALFGSWATAEAAIRAYKSTSINPHVPFDDAQPCAPRRRSSYNHVQSMAKSIALLPEAGHLYSEIKEANPHLSHSEVVKTLPMRYRRAATRESLAMHGVDLVPARKGDEYRHAVDESLASHIERRKLEFVEKNVPFVISSSRLLSGHPRVSQRTAVLANFPKAAAALERCVETNEQHYRRLIKTAIRSGALEGLTPASEHIVDEMDLRRLNLLWARVNRDDETRTPSGVQQAATHSSASVPPGRAHDGGLPDDLFGTTSEPDDAEMPRSWAQPVSRPQTTPTALPFSLPNTPYVRTDDVRPKPPSPPRVRVPHRSQIRSTPPSFSLPPIHPDEPLSGYLARSCYIKKTSFCMAVTGSYTLPSWIVPSQIEECVRRLGDCVGSVDDVLNRNTLFPGYVRFVSSHAADTLRHRHLVGPQFAAPFCMSPVRGVHGHAWKPAICLSCLDEDLGRTGTPFWRREFLFTAVRFCARHETPLYEFCSACAHAPRASIAYAAPQGICNCGGPLQAREQAISEIGREIELDMARAWSTLLDHKFAPEIRGPHLSKLLLRAASENGLVNDGRIELNRYQDLISNPDQVEIAMRLGAFTGSSLIQDALSGKECPRNPFVTIFMLNTLFGSWKAARSAITSQEKEEKPREIIVSTSVIGEADPTRKRKSDTARQRAKALARLPETTRLYNAEREANPHLSHSQIVERLPATCRKAATRDNLRQHGADLAPARIGAEYRLKVGKSLASTIERRWKTFIDMEVQFRISMFRLLEGLPTEHYQGLAEKFPDAAVAAERFAETWEAFFRRVVKSAIRAGKLAEFAPEDEHTIEEMEISKVKQLWKRVRRNRENS